MKPRFPDLRFDLQFVGHGYQLDIYRDGKKIVTECHDFADNHNVGKITKIFGMAIVDAIEKARKKL